MWTLIQTESHCGYNRIGYIDGHNPEYGTVMAMYRIDNYGKLDFYYQYEMMMMLWRVLNTGPKELLVNSELKKIPSRNVWIVVILEINTVFHFPMTRLMSMIKIRF